MKKRMISLGLALLLAAGCLAGCSSTQEITLKKQEKQVVLKFGWWGNDPRHTYTIEAVEKFEELHPDIKVTFDYGEFSNYQTRWNINMKAGKQDDVMQVNYAWMKNYADQGYEFYDLNELKDTIDLSSYSDKSISYGTVNDKLYALPIALNCKTFVYDKAVLEKYQLEVPETWEDIFAAAQVLSKDGIYLLDLEQSSAWFVIESYWEQVTGKSFATDGKYNFTPADLQFMLEFYKKLIDAKVTQDPSTRDVAHYSDGVYAGGVMWITDTAKYEGMLPEGHSYVVGAYPVVEGASRTGKYIKPATMYTISKNTEHPKEAAMLLDFLVNSEEMAMLQQTEKGVPDSSKQKEVLVKNGLLKGILSEAAEAIDKEENYLLDKNYEADSIKDGLKTAIDSMLYNKVSAATAAKTYYSAIMAELNK